MTGLFHRLARQVVGPEPPRARSTARLPFAGPPALDERHAVAAHPPEPPRSTEVPEDALRQDEAESGGSALRAQALPPRLMHAEPREPGPGGPPATPADPDTAPADTRTDAGAAGPTLRETAPGGPETPEPAIAVSARRPEEPAAQPRRRASPAPDTPPPPRRLLPEVSAHADAARQMSPPTPPGPSRADATESPEIHVHIGRIDVTSVSEPQQRRDPPRRRAAPRMSLEDYLAGRKSGGP